MHVSIFERRKRNLRALIDARYGGSQAALSRAIGRAPSYVWRLLADGAHTKRLGEDLARAIERASGLPDFWLDNEQVERDVLLMSSPGAEVAPVPQAQGPRSVPIYAHEALDLSNPSEPRGQVVGLAFTDTRVGPRSFVLVVRGRALEPEYREGDRVFIDPGVAPAAGDVVLALSGNTPVLRQFRPAEDGTFELSSPSQIYAAIPSERVRAIVGTVVEHHRYRKPD